VPIGTGLGALGIGLPRRRRGGVEIEPLGGQSLAGSSSRVATNLWGVRDALRGRRRNEEEAALRGCLNSGQSFGMRLPFVNRLTDRAFSLPAARNHYQPLGGRPTVPNHPRRRGRPLETLASPGAAAGQLQCVLASTSGQLGREPEPEPRTNPQSSTREPTRRSAALTPFLGPRRPRAGPRTRALVREDARSTRRTEHTRA